ncbi:hypothetical protein DFQ27_009346 [Actinomortierella ambigua]|uniref:Uncharacterized protein n=1 Tax=Actinomortierella ambigua TaxID=1343610 RepID=A0A9P6QJC3_9FUNG|nr:hypothetical protein DFQ27_009346 [Actinomortierella ambigua]
MTTFLGTLAHGATFTLKDDAENYHPFQIRKDVDSVCIKLETPLTIVDAVYDGDYCMVYTTDDCTELEASEGDDYAWFGGGDHDNYELGGSLTVNSFQCELERDEK